MIQVLTLSGVKIFSFSFFCVVTSGVMAPTKTQPFNPFTFISLKTINDLMEIFFVFVYAAVTDESRQ